MKKRMISPLSFFMFAICLCAGWAGGASAQVHGERPSPPIQPAPQPTQPPASSAQDTKEVVFGQLKAYTHSSGWFSINVPGNWTVKDKSVEGELIVTMADPTENAVLVIRVWTRQTQMTSEEKTQLLKTFLNNSMATFPGFAMNPPKEQEDGSVGIYFEYDSVVENKSYPMTGNSFVEQRGNLVGLMGLIMPKEQYNRKKVSALKFINSFSLNSGSVRQ